MLRRDASLPEEKVRVSLSNTRQGYILRRSLPLVGYDGFSLRGLQRRCDESGAAYLLYTCRDDINCTYTKTLTLAEMLRSVGAQRLLVHGVERRAWLSEQ